MRFLLAFLTLVCFSLLPPTPLAAQDRPNTILVLDGSGSMWGQIDGINKIVIARDVVGELLQSFPEDQNLGLAAYGHRTRGDCADIETLVAPGPDTLPAIRDAVQGISPKGKTPMTDAIIAAAKALRYTEEKASVILVSDGIETCHPDPCAAARVLEEAGIDFTAHVVGFDVTDPAALAQMRCLAEETGGTFTSASNAGELTTALATVVAEPVYVPQTVQIVGVLQPNGAEIAEPIAWRVQPLGGAETTGTGPGFQTALTAGDHEVIGTRTSDGVVATASFAVAQAEADTGQRIEVVFPAPAPDPADITFRAVIGSEDGPEIDTPVLWDITADGTKVADSAEGNPFVQALDQGSYVVTAYWLAEETESAPRQFIASTSPRDIVVVFEKPLPRAVVTAPATAVAGSTIEVGWSGPNATNDYLGVGTEDATGAARWQNYTYTREGAPLMLQMPLSTGPHTITYFLDDTRTPLATATIHLTPPEVSVTAPATAEAGSRIEVGWVGPNYTNDYIGIGAENATGAARWQNYTYTREGANLMLQVPPEPGTYTITYFADQDRVALASTTIEVTAPQVGVTAPATAVAGSVIEVGWVGPNATNDYLGVGVEGATGGARWQNYTYTREGNPLKLQMPLSTGPHTITYFLDQDRTALASTTITLTAPEVSVTAPAAAEAGSRIEVGWVGPNYTNDYIGIGADGATGGARWQNYTYTREGNPLMLQVPPQAGTYTITYFADQDRIALATTTLTVTQPVVSVTAPTTGVGGDTIEVAWQGPNQANDYLGIGSADATGSARWRTYTYTREGNPLKLRLPIAEGPHVIRYFLDQDRTEMASTEIMLTMPQATLTAPATAAAGSTIEIGWTGPNYGNDYVGVGPAGASGAQRWQTYTYTREGNPMQVRMPDAPGNYVIRYFVDQDRVALVEVPITLE